MTQQLVSSPTPTGLSTTEGWSMFDYSIPLQVGDVVEEIGFWSDARQQFASVKLAIRNSPGSWEVIYSEPFDHPGGGLRFKTLAAPIPILYQNTCPGSFIQYPAPSYSGSTRVYKLPQFTDVAPGTYAMVEDGGNTRGHAVRGIPAGNPPPPPPPPASRAVVAFHSWSNPNWVGPTSFTGNPTLIAPQYSNSDSGDVISQVDSQVPSSFTSLDVVGASGGADIALWWTSKRPQKVKRVNVWLPVYDRVKWLQELPDGGDKNILLQLGANGPLPYYERSARWTVEDLAGSGIHVIVNGAVQDQTTPFHHAEQLRDRLLSIPGITSEFHAWNITHQFDAPQHAIMVQQLPAL